MSRKIVALAGGVGGAKLADGLYRVLEANALTVIVNTGDDFEHLGLRISPDVDTVCYTLAGIANEETGWGRADESWNALGVVGELGGPEWFRLGDTDLGLHLERMRRLARGEKLSEITADFCNRWGVAAQVIPMSDQVVSTFVETDEGRLAFQDYFVARRCEPSVKGFEFAGLQDAEMPEGAREAIEAADFVVICPSNPWVSVDPILGVQGIRAALDGKVILAVTPIIGGEAVKGPAAKMFRELGIDASAKAVAEHYGELLTGFVLDKRDEQESEAIGGLGIMTAVFDTWMKSSADRVRLAEEVLLFGEELLGVRE